MTQFVESSNNPWTEWLSQELQQFHAIGNELYEGDGI